MEPEGFPNPVHTLPGHPGRRRHRANTPLAGIPRGGLERLDYDRLDLVVADAPWCAAARLVQQRGDTASHKPRSPLANRRIRQAQLARDLAVGAAITAPQHNLRAQCQPMGSLAAYGPALQRRSIFDCQPQLRQRTASRVPNNSTTCRHFPTLTESSGTGH